MGKGLSGGLNVSNGGIGGKVCYTSSNSRTTTCVHASTHNGGTVGASITVRFK